MAEFNDNPIFLAPFHPNGEVDKSHAYSLHVEGGDEITRDGAWLGLIALMSVYYKTTPVGSDDFFDFTNQVLLPGSFDEDWKRRTIDGLVDQKHIPAVVRALELNAGDAEDEMTNKRLKLHTDRFQQGHISMRDMAERYDREGQLMGLTENIEVIDDQYRVLTTDTQGEAIPYVREEILPDSDLHLAPDDLGFIQENPPTHVIDISRLVFANYHVEEVERHSTYGHLDEQGDFQPFVTVLNSDVVENRPRLQSKAVKALFRQLSF